MTTYTKLPLDELEKRFAQCRAEPSMRSVTAILRITREQVGARGFLGHYPRAAIGSLVLAVALFGVLAFVPAEFRKKLIPPAIGAVIIAAVLGYGAVNGAADRRNAAEQERRLKELAAESLDEILAAPFNRKPLEWEQVGTLKDLAKAFPERPRLKELAEAQL